MSTRLAALILALSVPGTLSAGSRQGDPDAPADAPREAVRDAARDALAPVSKRMEQVRHLRARFDQEQESLLLAEPIVSSGRLFLRTDPATVVLLVEGDEPVKIRSDARSHLVYHVSRKRAERFLFERNELAGALLACLSGDMETLERAFDVRACRASNEGPSERVHIVLAPREERLREQLRQLEVLVDPVQATVTRVGYENADGERVTLSLGDVELDPDDWSDPRATFSALLPPDVEVTERRVRRPSRD